jgi:hypothetical protein
VEALQERVVFKHQIRQKYFIKGDEKEGICRVQSSGISTPLLHLKEP